MPDFTREARADLNKSYLDLLTKAYAELGSAHEILNAVNRGLRTTVVLFAKIGKDSQKMQGTMKYLTWAFTALAALTAVLAVLILLTT